MFQFHLHEIQWAGDWRLCRAFILQAVLVVQVPGMGTKCAVAVGCSPPPPLVQLVEMDIITQCMRARVYAIRFYTTVF